jgi:hypothetical protein
LRGERQKGTMLARMTAAASMPRALGCEARKQEESGMVRTV